MKKTVALILTVLLMLTLVSCVREVYDIDITTNGGKVKQEEIITKEIYDSLISMGTDPSDFEAAGYELSFYEDDGTEYVKATLIETFDTVEELSAYLSSIGAGENEDENTDIADAFFADIKIEVDEENNTILISGKVNEQEDVSAYSSCKVVLNFPGKVIEHNIGKKTNRNSISIDMMDIWEESETPEFTIKSEISSSESFLDTSDSGGLVIAIIVIVCVIAVAAVAFVVIKKKSSKKDSDSGDGDLDSDESGKE